MIVSNNDKNNNCNNDKNNNFRLTREPIEGAEEILNQCRRWGLLSGQCMKWSECQCTDPSSSTISTNWSMGGKILWWWVKEDPTRLQKIGSRGDWIFSRWGGRGLWVGVGGGLGLKWPVMGEDGLSEWLATFLASIWDHSGSTQIDIDIIILTTLIIITAHSNPNAPLTPPFGHIAPQTLNSTIWNWHHR